MKIYNKLSDFKAKGNAIVTTGTFDGVHIGHQLIIKRLIEKAKEMGGESVLLTFWPHPRLIISPNENNLKLLTTIDEKTAILETLDIDHFIVLPFSREFSELSSEKYISEILLDGLGTKAMVIGYDHRFGKNREGGIDYLKKHAERFKIEIEEISRQEIENITISSTKIRNAILDGNIVVANELLGRPYSFSGPVVKGRQLGRTIGFPTANIQIQKKYKLIPKNGVYATFVYLRGQKYSGIMNIGNRPTVEGHGRSQEVHIFDFSDDIYGETVKIEILDFIREEIKFENVDKLVEQIELDCFAAKQIISQYA
ncbi:bifunctional riboflavin kinase/FAD synthetase [Lacihabitans sp. LS3-19]|uniref:bifunctional riboflavin kinase/FAD synthetase n=1 Tax=Lacihabitans sp. LS3-19 TaxID=2487335 RepID=UPI0020CE32CA|nr:bifunctional riboflavin kinase/FAD synthetase [Lacihabitans sp. LS3-19]MCP9767634.1 bifunctional riboflavin kinase/FAD synthetase [Lacihabitans sp. LS3-19]